MKSIKPIRTLFFTPVLCFSIQIQAQSLTFENGATITIEEGGLLSTEGNLNLPIGAIDNKGTIRFTGSNSKTFDANGQSIRGIIEFNGGKTTLTDRLIVAAGQTNFGLLKITGTGILETNNNLTLVIDSIGYTGRIDEISSTAYSPLLSNNDSIVIYTTSGNNSHRFLGNPFNNKLVIRQFFDDTLEFDVTGKGGKSNGFSTNTGTNNPSAFTYDEKNNTWKGFSSGYDSISVGEGASFYIMNRKGQKLSEYGAEFPYSTRINLAGSLRNGTIKKELTNDGSGWNLISNPYPSNISISLTKSPSKNWKNINGSVYYYDKKNKSFITFNRNNGAKTGKMTDVIPMGSSFLVQADINKDSIYIVFEESMKTDRVPSNDLSNPSFLTIDTFINRFGITITNKNPGKSEEDQAVFLFGNDRLSSDLYDRNFDTKDLTSDVVNIAIITDDNYKLAISSYPMDPVEYNHQKFPLSIKTSDKGTYSLSFESIGKLEQGVEVWLHDKSSDYYHPIFQSPYFFRLLEKSRTSIDNRFEIILKFDKKELSDSELNKTNQSNGNLNLYPNPVHLNEKINIVIPSADIEPIKLQLTNNQGQLVEEKDISPTIVSKGYSYFDFSCTSCTPGIYQVQLITKTQSFSNKLLLIP